LEFDSDSEGYNLDTLAARRLEFDSDSEGYNSDDEEEDLMYGANDYGEVPIPEQLDEDMDIMDVNEPEKNQELEDDLHEGDEAWEIRWAAEEAFRKTPVVQVFPSAKAGAPITNIQALPRYDSYKMGLKRPDNPWDPFSSRLDWEVAHWAKRWGPGATAFTELLKIDGVSPRLRALTVRR
jgi:hypothetical protein